MKTAQNRAVSNLEIGLLIKPLVALVLFGLIALPLRIAFSRWFPSGRLKRLLLTPLRKEGRPRL
jgi:hypothetical protein